MRRNLSEAQFGNSPNVPPPPGELPVPQGHARLLHSAIRGGDQDEIATALRSQGIDLGKARGETYGEPNRVWAVAGDKPYNATAVTAEFSAPPDEMDIGRHSSPEELERGRAHVTLNRSVGPEEILAVHQPWHRTYRSITTDPLSARSVQAGEYDDFLEPDQAETYPAEARAIREAKTDLIYDRIRNAKRAVR